MLIASVAAQSEANASVSFRVTPVTAGTLGTPLYQQTIKQSCMFELMVNNQSIGLFAEGQTVDFTVHADPSGVSAFRLIGIDAPVDSTDGTAFPIKLEFDTPTADFTMVPVIAHKVGASCTPNASCPTCPSLDLDIVGDPVLGNLGFELEIQGAPQPGIGIAFANLGQCQSTPYGCGDLVIGIDAANLGLAVFNGAGTCGGSGTFALPLPNLPAFYGTFVCAQGAVLCAGGGLALTNGVQFAIGN